MNDTSLDSFPSQVVDAIYRPAMLPHQLGNPLIEALPPHPDVNDLLVSFGRSPPILKLERNLPRSVRIQSVSLLNNYLEPLPKHFAVHEKLCLVLRGGYNHRNPLDRASRKVLNEFYADAMNGIIRPISQPIPSAAPAFSLFGMSGLGKSSTIEQTLSFFPQVLRHRQHGFIQIVWLKLDCPVHGNLKDLLLEILGAIDELIGTRYRPEKRRDRTIPELIVDVARIAARHYLGLLVIDEVQNLIDAPGISRADLLKFFVTMGNVAKIPFAFIGTPRALKLFQTLFHSARRAENFGSLIWLTMPHDPIYDHFTKKLFRYQWTRTPTEWTEEISQCLHDSTHGVEALTVRLYQLTQIAAIRSGDAETMSPSLFREIAASEFNLLQPMLDALRSGKVDSGHLFEDLFIRGLEDLGIKVTSEIAWTALQERSGSMRDRSSARSSALTSLLALHYDRADADERIDCVFRSNPDATPEEAVRQVLLSSPGPMSGGRLGDNASMGEIVANAVPGESAADTLRRAGLIDRPIDQTKMD